MSNINQDQHLRRMVALAKQLEWGSGHQIAAENEVCEAFLWRFPDREEELETFAHKATTNERMDWIAEQLGL